MTLSFETLGNFSTLEGRLANWSNVLKGIARTVEIAMESKGECAFWNCTKTVRSGYVLCYSHFKGSAAGRVNVCGGCRRYKDARYKQCLNCRERSGNSGSPFEGKNNVTVTAPATRPAKSYEPEYSPAWEAGDKEAPGFLCLCPETQRWLLLRRSDAGIEGASV